jgi:hypothetical protein
MTVDPKIPECPFGNNVPIELKNFLIPIKCPSPPKIKKNLKP